MHYGNNSFHNKSDGSGVGVGIGGWGSTRASKGAPQNTATHTAIRMPHTIQRIEQEV